MKMPAFLKNLFSPKKPVKKISKISLQETYFIAGWILFSVIIGLSFLSLILDGAAWMFFWLGVSALYAGTCLHEIKDPNEAYLFRFGKMIGRLESGWYLIIPHLWEIRDVSREVVVLKFERQNMFTVENTSVQTDISAVVQIGKTEPALLKALELNPKDRDELFKQMILSKVRTEVGKQSFTGLNKGQSELEETVLKSLKKELTKYGYRAREVEVYNIEESVLTEAERIKIIGRARGEEAKAISEPLKDNWPAAAVALGNIFLEKPVKNLKKSVSNQKGAETVASAIGGIKSAVSAITEKISGKERSDDASSS